MPAAGAAPRNVAGSFFGFTAEHFDGTHATTLVAPPAAWGARSAAAWAEQLPGSPRFDPAAEHFACSAEVLDRIYGRQEGLNAPDARPGP